MPDPTGRVSHLPEMHRGVAWKEPVRCATTASVTIATALNVGDAIDGVTLVAGDRVLVKDQASASQNGIYVAGASPARAYDMDQDATSSVPASEVLGAHVYIIEGSQAGTRWYVTNTSAPVIGSDAIDWAQWTASGMVALADDLAVEVVLDGGGSAITTGVKCDIHLPFTGHVRGWRLLGDDDIVVDVWKDTYANYPPIVGDSMIGAGTKPTLSGVTKNEAYPTNWTTTAFTAGDIIRINVDSADATLATLSLTVDRT